MALPGQVQFENYDTGGNDVAYHDTTSGNSGGKYRSNNVDIATTTDSGGGYVVGWVQATEWLKYSVTVATAGSARFFSGSSPSACSVKSSLYFQTE